MRCVRINVLVAPADLGQPELEVAGEAYQHLFRVRRLQAGQVLRLVDGQGRARRGTVIAIDRRSARVQLTGEEETWEPRLRLELAVATLRPERASWLVEKATELGVHAVTFFGCERAPRRYGESQLQRLRRVACAALEQSGGALLPELRQLDGLETLLGAAVGATTVLDPEAARAAPFEGVAGQDRGRRLIVGPEGGLTDDERHRLVQGGVRAVGLGGRILRTETAALAAAALVLLDPLDR